MNLPTTRTITSKGFALIELLIVVVIAGVIIATTATANAQSCTPPTVVPTCAAGQVLTSDGTALTCVTPSGGGLVKFGGSYLIGGGVNNAGLPVPCMVPNIVTHACSCPAGYTAVVAGYGEYYWYSPWDGYQWGYLCEALQ